MAGQHLGPYEIVESIGAGGMGEVWRAKDTRLGRDVAIKVLPPGFAENQQFLQRFEREARTISSLNHPHICTLYDVGEAAPERGGDPAERAEPQSSTLHYLVMELVEGESLADRLKKGPLPLQEVLQLGRQIASALDAAHRKGVIHRDLKPGNVMVTRSGAKLLDFGLAKSAAEGSAPVDGLTSLPTEAKPLTQEGTILGTFQYMAPEQLEGLEADARTDIFALGALLYEMATGRRAFRAESKTSLIAAIVSSQPEPISNVTPMSPPALDHVVRRCLEKDPDDRWQSAHDIATELQWISEAGSQAGVATPVTMRRKSRERLAWSIAIIATAAALVVAFLWYGARSARSTTSAWSAVIPPDMSYAFGNGGLAISPDGNRIAFTARRGDEPPMIYIRDRNRIEPIPLDDTAGAEAPFWSPDGTEIGFFADEKLKRIMADGSRRAQTLADAPRARGGAWGPDGRIVFAPTQGALFELDLAGGAPRQLTEPAEGDFTHRWPAFTDDGKYLLYLRMASDRPDASSASGIYLREMATGRDSRLNTVVSAPLWSDGKVLFAQNGTLMAQEVDTGAAALQRQPFPVAENIEFTNYEIPMASVSRHGTLVFHQVVGSGAPEVAWYSLDGRRLEDVDTKGEFWREVSLSPDQKRLAVVKSDGLSPRADLWVHDLERGLGTRLTQNEDHEEGPVWDPSGEFLYFSIVDQTYTIRADGLREIETILPPFNFVDAVFDDGRLLTWNPNTFDLSIASPTDGSMEGVETSYREWSSYDLSPDETMIAYVSPDSGAPQVYVRPLTETRRIQISLDIGYSPVWIGNQIFFQGEEVGGVAQLMVADVVEENGRLTASRPREILRLPFSHLDDSPFEVSLDGSRILAITFGGATETRDLTVLENWSEAR